MEEKPSGSGPLIKEQRVIRARVVFVVLYLLPTVSSSLQQMMHKDPWRKKPQKEISKKLSVTDMSTISGQNTSKLRTQIIWF
jgi:hypothetical protein